MRMERKRIRGARTAGWNRRMEDGGSVVDTDLTGRGKWEKRSEEIRRKAEFVGQEGVEGGTHKAIREQGDSTQTAREESRKSLPWRETRIHAEPIFCGRSLGLQRFLKLLCAIRTPSYPPLLYFIPCSAGAAESARRFHWANLRLISKMPS